MLPNFLINETTVRESGESHSFNLEEPRDQTFTLTLGITHATEQESLDVDIYASTDGRHWPITPIGSFTRKFYCGTYQITFSGLEAKFLKAAWRVNRWGRGQDRPFFRFYLFAQQVRTRVAGAA